MNPTKYQLGLMKRFQQNEITEYHIYNKLAMKHRGKNQRILKRIASEELKHYKIFRKYTGQDVKPNAIKLFIYRFFLMFFGLVFTVKKMERDEEDVQLSYPKLKGVVKEIGQIIKEENTHENELAKMLHEEHLHYLSSIVLGLNDALVELTGALAGLSFALQNTRLVAVAGLITGIAAALSMAASEYLSRRSEGFKMPITPAIYTGVAYIITVIFLVSPFFFFEHYIPALFSTILIGLCIIFIFNYYEAITRETPFKKRFIEMASISMSVALVSFLIGLALRHFIGVDV